MRDIAEAGPDSTGWSLFGAGSVAGIGLCTLSVHLFHLISRPETLFITLLGAVFPMTLSVILLATSLWIYRRYAEEVVVWIGGWCFVATVVLVAVSVVSIAYQHSKGVMMTDLPFVVANHATVGAVLGALMGIYDGQRHRRGRRLQAERDRARKLSDRLTILNRVLRHDIRNCISVIRGNATLILSGKRHPDQAAEIIHSKAAELQDVSDRARQLEQLMERTMDEDLTVDVGSLLHEKIREIREEYPAVEFEIDIPESVAIRAPPLIELAIEELLHNAVEHNDRHYPRVDVTVSAPDSDLHADGGRPETVCIQICDNGPGIPEDQLEVIDRGRETDLDHTNGLGLWLVRWVVDASEGEITFDLNESHGSTVEIRMPTDDSRSRF